MCGDGCKNQEMMGLGFESLLHPSLALAAGVILGLLLNQAEIYWDAWRDRRQKEKR
jgi:hypothetical protein